MQNTMTGENAGAKPTRLRRAVGSNAVVGRSEAPTDQPTITLEKVDGVVQSIVVTCKCGEKIKIDCQYSGSSDSGGNG